MSEFKYNDPFLELEDRMADLRLQHAIQTGTLEMTTFDGNPVDCWQFCNRETGDVLTMSDPPQHLEYMVKSVLTVKNLDAEKSVDFAVEGFADEWPWLTIVIDHRNQPYVEVAPGEYLGVEPQAVTGLLDYEKYDMMATGDSRHIPNDEHGGIEVFLTPTHPGYTLAAAAINESLARYGDDTPLIMGATPVSMKSGPVLEEYCMGVTELPNDYDETGFNRTFSLNVVSGIVRAIEVRVMKLGSKTELGMALGDHTNFVMGREGWVLRYKTLNENGKEVVRLGTPTGIGDDYIRRLFIDGHIIEEPLDD